MMTYKKVLMRRAIGLTIGSVVGIAPLTASAVVLDFDWSGQFRMLNSTGNALANGSLGGKANGFQTPIAGKVSFDTITGAAAATMATFDFFSNNPTQPFSATAISFQAIDGGTGALLLANMNVDWNGNFNIPVSLVLDASGMFGAIQDGTLLGAGGTPNIGATVSGVGAVPAADGTYVGSYVAGKPGVDTNGYLSLGPVPIATTEFNTTASVACLTTPDCGFELSSVGQTAGSGLGVQVSGVLPLVADAATNTAEYLQGDGVGIGGSPSSVGPYLGFNINFDITDMTLTGVNSIGSISRIDAVFENVSTVPVPAALWLFGSGLMSLVGVARSRKV